MPTKKPAGKAPAPAKKTVGKVPAPAKKPAGKAPAPAKKTAGKAPAPAKKKSAAKVEPVFSDYKIRDIGLAEAGRKELDIAEKEMPGLMAVRKNTEKRNR